MNSILTLKNNKKSLLIFFGFMAFLTFTRCTQEGCTNPSAENYEVDADEDDGSCFFARDAFFSEYNVNESCDSGDWSYSMTITPQGGTDNGVVITNLGGWEDPVIISAVINGSEISFNDTDNDIIFSGNGTLSGNTLTITYDAAIDGNIDSCVATCVKE